MLGDGSVLGEIVPVRGSRPEPHDLGIPLAQLSTLVAGLWREHPIRRAYDALVAGRCELEQAGLAHGRVGHRHLIADDPDVSICVMHNAITARDADDVDRADRAVSVLGSAGVGSRAAVDAVTARVIYE
jgi:hypothetical protein